MRAVPRIAVALTTLQIPYQIVGGTRFFDRAEIKDVLAYLVLSVNPNDDSTAVRPWACWGAFTRAHRERLPALGVAHPPRPDAFDRAVSTPPRDIGQVTLEHLHAAAIEARQPIVSYVRALLSGHAARPASLHRLPTKAFTSFLHLVDSITALVHQVRSSPCATASSARREHCLLMRLHGAISHLGDTRASRSTR